MIIWEKDAKYYSNLDSDDRESLAEEIASLKTRKQAKNINLWINILMPFAMFFIFGFNLIAFAVAFILCDIILCFMDNLIFNYIPYKTSQNLSISSIQKRVEKLKKELEITTRKIEKLRDKYCSDCRYCRYYDECTRCKEMYILCSNKNWLEEKIECDEKYIKKTTEEIKEKEALGNTKTSKDYNDKMEYFKNMKEKLRYFNKNKDMEFLKPIIKSLGLLINTLNKRPVGFSLVPTSIYIYLDELQSILEKLKTLEEDKKNTYIKDIEKISNMLSENIESLNSRINNFEVEDIEVGINVLLQELTKESEEEKDV